LKKKIVKQPSLVLLTKFCQKERKWSDFWMVSIVKSEKIKY
jgi:hypothetical protein